MKQSSMVRLMQSPVGRYGLIVLACGIFVGMVFFLKGLLPEEEPTQKKRVQQITMITPPPPPPPPPPEEEIKEPEPEDVIEEELEEALPEEGPDESVGEDLGVDAEGEAGSDAFGLAAKKGGRGLLGGGKYASALKAELNKGILKDEALRALSYEAVITVWINDDGSFKRYKVEMLTGSDRVREELERFLNEMGGFARAKPFEEEANRFRWKIGSVI